MAQPGEKAIRPPGASGLARDAGVTDDVGDKSAYTAIIADGDTRGTRAR
jgi:hypothetical protein